MDKKERLLLAFNYLKKKGIIRTQKELADKIDSTPPNVSSALRGVESVLTDNFLKRFCAAFDMFSYHWLLTGEGTMLKRSDVSVVEPPRYATVRLVSQYAYAGYLGGYGDVAYVDSLPTIPFLPDREMTGNWLAFEIKGDSMDDGTKDSYVEGEIVICREVEREYWRDSKLFYNRRDFVIVHADGILIKRVVEHDLDTHTIKIHSLNPLYPDRVIDLADVRQIFSIVESRMQRRR